MPDSVTCKTNSHTNQQLIVSLALVGRREVIVLCIEVYPGALRGCDGVIGLEATRDPPPLAWRTIIPFVNQTHCSPRRPRAQTTSPTCVPSTIPLAVRRSTLARYVAPNAPTCPSRSANERPRPTSAGACFPHCLPVADRPRLDRGNSTSAAIAKFSASRTAKPNPSFSSARILDESHGPLFTEDSTRRASVR